MLMNSAILQNMYLGVSLLAFFKALEIILYKVIWVLLKICCAF